MNPDQYARMYEVEDSHWWYVGLRGILASGLNRMKATCAERRPRILDAGCGTGANAILAGKFGDVVAADVSPLALKLAANRNLSALSLASIDKLPFGAYQFDCVMMTDVLYHQQVDSVEASLAESFRVLRPGGFLLIHTAALETLRGKHDAAVHTRRRFGKAQLRSLLSRGGFEIEVLCYRCFLISLPLLIKRRLHIADRVEEFRTPGKLVNRLLAGLLELENQILLTVGLPFGSSLYCVARKPAA